MKIQIQIWTPRSPSEIQKYLPRQLNEITDTGLDLRKMNSVIILVGTVIEQRNDKRKIEHSPNVLCRKHPILQRLGLCVESPPPSH